MATVYTTETKTGDYTWTRVRVVYSGTSGTAYLQYKRTNSHATNVRGATFSFGGSSIVFNASNTTTNGSFVDIGPSVSFTVDQYNRKTYSGSSTPNSINGVNNYFRGSWSVTIDAQATQNSYPYNVRCSASNSGRSVTVSASCSFGYPNSGSIAVYRTTSGSTSGGTYIGTIYSSSGTVSDTIPAPDTSYYYYAIATNGASMSTKSSSSGSVSTSGYGPTYSPSISAQGSTQTSISLYASISSFGFPSSGTLIIEGGASTGSLTEIGRKSGSPFSFTHTGLSAGTTYYYRVSATNGRGTTYSSVISATTKYAPPVGITATFVSSPEDGKAISTVSVTSWGDKSTANSFAILNNGKSVLVNSTATGMTSNEMTWNIPSISTNTMAGAVNTWYGRATNNHSEYADSGAYYITTPSAPVITFYGHTGIHPNLTLTSSVTYTGGTANSTTANTATLRNWTFIKTCVADNTTETITRPSSTKTGEINYTMDEFKLGSDYTFTTKVSNNYGGIAQTTTKTFYKPSGVGGAPTMITPDQVELKGSATAPGGMGDTTSGTLSCYQIRWGKTADNLENYTPVQVSPYFDLIDLEPGVTYYYQVIAWNTYGLSGLSPVLNFTTGGRYLPTVKNFTYKGLNPGADITVEIGRSGGVTPNELVVNRITIEIRPSGTEEWEMKKDIDGLELTGGDTYTIENVWDDYLPQPGDYEMRVVTYNEYDSGRKIFTLVAPTVDRVVAPGLDGATPTQIKLNATVTAGTAVASIIEMSLTGASLKIEKTDKVAIPSGKSQTAVVISPNHLLFATTYVAYVTVRDEMGLWNTTANGVFITTPARVNWYFVTPSKTSTGTAQYRNSGILYGTKDAYYIVAHALGTDATVGTNLKKKRLKFIAQPLFYRPESVASMTLSDGRRLGYEFDENADMYKFGIWEDDRIAVTFFDGEKWLVDHYDFDDADLTITAIDYDGKGINASSAFSTTAVEEV